MDEQNQNLSSGIPTYDFAAQNNLAPINVPTTQSPLGDGSLSVAQDIQKKYSPQSVNIGQGLYSTKSNSLWDTNTTQKPSFERWNNNLDSAYVKLNDGTYKARFESYMSGVDNEDRLGQQQGAFNKVLNGVGKFIAKTGINALDGTLGTVNGVLQGIDKGSFNAVYNNDFSKWVDDLNTKLDYDLPNYYTEQEKNGSLLGNVATTNFWADKVLGGMSFVTGTLISEGIWAAATGGGSLATLGARGVLRESAGALRTENRVMHSITSLMNSYQRTVPVSKALKAFNNARFILTSAGYESGVEARHYLKEAEANFIQHYATQYGRRPTGEEMSAFKENSLNSANAVFGANLALVGGSNIAMFGNIMGLGSFASTQGLQRGFGRALGIGTERVIEEGVDVYRALNPTRTQRILGTAYNVLKSPFREGVIEEGGQHAVADFGQRWLASKYDAAATNDNFSTIDAMGKSLAATYGTKAGQEDVLIGALIGGLGSGVTGAFDKNSSFAKGAGFTTFNDQVTQQQQFATWRTANSDYNLLSKFTSAATQKASRGKVTQAADTVEANQELQLAVFSKLQVDDKMGLLDDSTENFRASLNEMDVNEVAQQLNVSVEEAQKAKDDAISFHESSVNDFKEAQKYAESVIPNGLNINVEGVNSFVPSTEAQSMLALNIYMGRNSDRLARNYAKGISDIIGDNGVASALSLENTLQDKQVNKSKEVKKLAKELDFLDRSMNSRNSELEKIAAKPRTTEGDSKLANFENRRQEILAAMERDNARREEINSELQGISQDINNVRKARRIANQNFATNFDDENVTPDNLLEATQSLNSLAETLNTWKTNGHISSAQDVEYMIGQFDKSQQAFRYANEVFNKLSDPVLRKPEVKNIFGKFLSKAKKAGADISDYDKAQQDLFNILRQQYLELKAVNNIFAEEVAEPQTPAQVIETGDALPPLQTTNSAREEAIKGDFAERRKALAETVTPELEITFNKGDLEGSFVDGLTYVAEGSESFVYQDKDGNIIKIGEPHQGDSFTTRVAEQLLLNKITNTPLQLIGYYYSEDSKGNKFKNPVFKQAFVEGEKATEEQIDAHFESKGFTKTGRYSYENEELSVSDLDGDNVIIDKDGAVNIIDAYVQEKNPSSIENIATSVEQQLAQLEQEEKEALAEIAPEEIIPTVPATLKEKLQQYVDTILKGRRQTEEISQPMKRPTTEQMEEYKVLYERNRRSKNGLKPADLERFNQLRDVFNRYGRAVGTVDGSLNLADILEQIANLNDLAAQEITQTTSNTNTEEIQAILSKASGRYDSFNKTQFYEKSEFRVLEDGRFSITGINLQGLVDIIAKDNAVRVLNDKIKGQKNNRKEATALTGEDYNVGDKFIVQLAEGVEIGVTIGATKGLEISPAAAQIINENTRFKLIPSTTLGTNYQPLLIELNRNAEITPLEVAATNFELEPGLTFTDITNLPDNTEMTLQISLRNPFNKNLLQQYNSEQITRAELQSQIAIYVTSQEGEVGGILKATSNLVHETPAYDELARLRAIATDRALNSKLENEVIDTQIVVPLDRGNSYFGKPNFNLSLNKTTGVLSTELLPLSDKAMKKVVDVGFISNERLTLRDNKREEKNIDTTFVKKMSKGRKLPIIVFNYNGSRVAYPVSMNETQRDKVAEFTEILNAGGSINDTVNNLNTYLNQNGIDPALNGFYNVVGESNINDQAQLKKITDNLAAQSTYADFTEWLNTANLEEAKQMVQEQSSINIDITDKPFHSPKLALKLAEHTIIGEVNSPSRSIVETAEVLSPEVQKEISDKTCG